MYADYIREVIDATSYLIADATVSIWTAPGVGGAQLSPLVDGGTLDLVVNGSGSIGDAYVVVRNDTGDGLQGTLPEGAAITVASTPYVVVTAVRQAANFRIYVQGGLTAAVTDGDAVAIGATSQSQTGLQAAVLSTLDMPAGEESANITFGVSVARIALSFVPKVGDQIEKTDHDGRKQSGSIVLLDDHATELLIYAGDTRKS